MKAILSSMIIVSMLNCKLAAQDFRELIVDTTITLSDGSVGRLYYRSVSNPNMCDFSSVTDFRSSSMQIVKSLADDGVRLQREHSKWERRINQEQQLREQLKTKKIAMFSEIIGLTANEAQKFWPVYNEYNSKKEHLLIKRRETIMEVRDPYLNLSSAQSTTLTDRYINSIKSESDLNQEYYRKFKAILSPSKLLHLYRAEEEYKIMLLRTIRDER